MQKTNKRQTNGFKHCSDAYITVNGILYKQWSDCDDKQHAQAVIERSLISNPTYKFITRKRDNFYRVYFTELNK